MRPLRWGEPPTIFAAFSSKSTKANAEMVKMVEFETPQEDTLCATLALALLGQSEQSGPKREIIGCGTSEVRGLVKRKNEDQSLWGLRTSVMGCRGTLVAWPSFHWRRTRDRRALLSNSLYRVPELFSHFTLYGSANRHVRDGNPESWRKWLKLVLRRSTHFRPLLAFLWLQPTRRESSATTYLTRS